MDRKLTARKAAASLSSKPTPTPDTSQPALHAQEPLDGKPKSPTKRELLLKALSGLQILRGLLDSIDDLAGADMVLNDIEAYVTMEKLEADKPIGFSSAKLSMLEDLDINAERFDFDNQKLREIARKRNLSDRFKSDLFYLGKAGISTKEQLSSIITVNYLLESMFNAPESTKQLDTNLKGRDIKFSPELTIPQGAQINPTTGVKYAFHGAADYVVFLVDNTVNLTNKDMKDLRAVEKVSEASLVVVEVKNTTQAFSDQHIAEAVTQAATASCFTNWDQRFIMTDSKEWKFCVYRPVERVYYLSQTLDVVKHGEKAILTALDEWIWFPASSESRQELWKFPTKSQRGQE